MTSMTDEIPNQKSLENGSENLIQYKKCKVSTLRSFPPKCGKNSGPITPEALPDVMVCIDDHVALHAQDNSVQSGVIVKAQSPVLEENQLNDHGLEESGEMEFQENGVVQHPEAKDSPHGNDTLETTCDVSESKAAAKTENGSTLSSEMEIQFDEATACPIFLEDTLAMDTNRFETKINGTTLNFESLRGIGADLVNNKLSGKEWSVKKPRKNVYATRNFPPNCGKNGQRSKIFLEIESKTESESNRINDNIQNDGLITEKEVITLHNVSSSGGLDYDEHVTIATLMATIVNVGGLDNRKNERSVNIKKPDWDKKSIATVFSKRSPTKKRKYSPPAGETARKTRSYELQKDSATGHNNGFIVNIPPFGSSSSQQTDARYKVKETLRLYQTICRKLMQGEEARSEKFERSKRIDLEAKRILDEKKVEVNIDKDCIGSVPGVEIGDEFQYRVELAIVGVHRLYQAGIDYIKKDDKIIATSIVASGVYADGWDNVDVLIYSGQGGNVVGRRKEPEDQKLERGNLALSNSSKTKNPIRVVRGSKEMNSHKVVITTYVYDGLYTVEKCWPETGPRGKMVYMFELRRIPGQPELAWKEVKNAKIGKVRRGVCVPDISGGQEKLPICAVNIIDDEKPPPFTYIRKMKYPDGFDFIPPQGCSCTTRCSASRKCCCNPRNGGGLPYNRNGAIVEVKPIVYECGPSCKCPPSCYNRVSQHGIKIQLEIFKTANRGWGVRSLSSIHSGSFICEYVGELLDDKEAELRTGSDEYLFDIGKNNRNIDPLSTDMDGGVEVFEEGGGGGGGGYTVDAAVYGNVGRFINHSCSPNLYAQDVLYDHDDKKMPHVMLFAADNIPPLQELTYDYNYSMNQVHDSNGNIKMKSCYCGSSECRGRMY